MGLAFLTPLFIGGLALLVAPWLIHQIHRPEREPLRFSSLMFIPKTRKEVIERRRVQNILLMLLRMAMLAFLAMAFARPYWRAPGATQDSPTGSLRHLILLDTSYSMAAGGAFEEAKAEALSLTDSLGPLDRVGVIAFAKKPQTLAPLFSHEDPEAGKKVPARRAIESASLSEESTAYVPALQAAQAMLLSAEGQSSEIPPRYVIHLLSDFQRVGMPGAKGRWKLDPRIELRCVQAGEGNRANCALEDVSVRETGSDQLRVRGKVRNWSSAQKATQTVKLLNQDGEISRTTFSIEPGAARQVSFLIPADPSSDLEGRLELDIDPLEIDNRRYFVHRATTQIPVLMLSSDSSTPQPPAARFLSSALPGRRDLPWKLGTLSSDAIKKGFLGSDDSPFILLLSDTQNLTPEITEAVRLYVQDGGRVLLTLDALGASATTNKGLLEPWGVRSEGPVYEEKRESRFAMLSWIDFDHPVFFSLRGSQFNDFSSIRFYNHHRLSILNQDAERETRVIARFEPDEEDRSTPAIIEARVGAGRVIIWAFGADLEWSNLPRSVKFIPLFYETLNFLGFDGDENRVRFVGDILRSQSKAPGGADMTHLTLPSGQNKIELAATAIDLPLRHAGFLRWSASDQPESALVEAVNVEARESNPEKISPAEFLMKLSSPRIAPEHQEPLDIERGSKIGGFIIQREFWRILIAMLFALFFLESWHAAASLR